MRKSQITAFIIMGLIIIVFFALALLVISSADTLRNLRKESPVGIYSFTSLCTKSVLENALKAAGTIGGPGNNKGYLALDENITTTVIENTATKESSSEFMQAYIDQHIPECFGGFEEFKKQGIGITSNSIASSVGINNKDVNARLGMNLQASKANKVFKKNDFSAQLPSDMNNFLLHQKSIVEEEEIALTMLDEIPHNITVLDIQNKNVYAIKSSGYKTPAYFVFARMQDGGQ